MRTTRRIAVAFGLAAAGAAALLFARERPPADVPSVAASSASDTLDVAIFAGGCFWCVEEAFDGVEGVVSTTSGFTGGHVEDPTYEQVTGGGTGHFEAVRVVYDPSAVPYERLLDVFWRNVDPTDAGGQFCDRGPSYRTAIFVHDGEQRRLAETSKARLERTKPFEEGIVTPILEAGPFWPADAGHQNYHRAHPVRYRLYKLACGRESRLDEVWGRG